jgi:eukaryotic-like serine/threonine-protein kinase
MAATFDVGDLVDGKYRILRTIGEGGWGIVFEAENVRTLKRVALKTLRPHAKLSADVIARFEREAQAAGRIGSEHIVEVFDLGTLADGTHYMVMELLQGEDLATRLATTTKLDPIVATKLVVQLLEGLICAHSAGILHRDLKPENLYLVPTRSGHEFLKILDFGISKFTQSAPFNATLTGAVLGSPYYMAPEQARGLKQLDPRTDLYSVGTVLFECVTGRVPFQGDNFNDLMFKIALSPRPNPADLTPGLDPKLAAIIMKSIEAAPENRFASAEHFRDGLVEWLTSRGIASVRPPDPRGIRVTPLDSRPRMPAKRGEEGFSISHNATLPADAGLQTPLSSSSTLQRARATTRKRIVVGGAVACAMLAGIVALSVARARSRPGTAEPTAGSAVVATATASAEPVPMADPAFHADPVHHDDVAPPTDDDAPPSTAHPAAPARAVAGSHFIAPTGPRPARSATSAPSAAPPPPEPKASASAPAPPATRRGSTVEGREIQTGL